MINKGLTLVEILCVIAILTILTAVLGPVLVRAKLDSKGTAAKQNLRGFWEALIV